MEIGSSSPAAIKKPTLTPKSIINQKFGNEACYKVEEVEVTSQNGCPGLVLPQKVPTLFRCRLQLPEFSVISGTFKKKKEAEQSAAEMALEKLGVHLTSDNPTVQDPWENLVSRIYYLFSNEFISLLHPLSSHFKAALRRKGDSSGYIPISVIASCDTKIGNLCKSINPKVETNPSLAISLINKAAKQVPGSVATSDGQLWMRRQSPYPPSIEHSATNQESRVPGDIWIGAIYIPCSLVKKVESLTLNVLSNDYYIDVIAQKLGVADASKVFISRIIGKMSSETRLYFSSESYGLDLSSHLQNEEKTANCEGSFNPRASYLSGQEIYGDAVMASIGYTWKSADLFYEDISLRSYHRMIICKTPSGIYKLSREAVLTADLPLAFTTRTNWRGSYPRDLLGAFCRQHRLSEPVFTTVDIALEKSAELSGSHKIQKLTESAGDRREHANGEIIASNNKESEMLPGAFRCEVKICSMNEDPIIECLSRATYKKRNDAIQHASLKVLLWLNLYFQELDMSVEKLQSYSDDNDIQVWAQNFAKKFSLCMSIHGVERRRDTTRDRLLGSNCTDRLDVMHRNGYYLLTTEGPETGASPTTGSLVCISNAVSLVIEGEDMKELLESSDEFEFEVGTGAVIPCIETSLTQMSVGQAARIHVDLPPQELILAAASDAEKFRPFLSSKSCCLEYYIVLLRVTEPLEERMEQAFFSPPLSKQRLQFALQHIKESGAISLIDFGCGSGSLLDSLLDFPTTLEKIVGVDISQKGLARAAKILHSKLSKNSDTTTIKSMTLYEGSITDVDSRVCRFDIGSCLEVIEHMEEDQACLFGDVALSHFRPKVLIVSTPNYEYNTILKRSNIPSPEEDPDEKIGSRSLSFRNHDHKFEWTREQFNCWASDLASRHGYSVEFSGVGGSEDLEPGFASQIAVFRRSSEMEGDYSPCDVDPTHNYKVIWEWSKQM